MNKPLPKKNDYTVSSVETALELLMLIGDIPGRGLSELSRASGIAKARTFRLLQTLESTGFVTRSGKDAHYWLGARSRQLGEFARHQIDLASVVEPVAQEIVARSRETVQVRVRQGLESYCVHVSEPDRIIRYHGEIGSKLPLHIGSSKILLAYASKRLQNAVLSAPLARLTSATLADATSLAEALAEIREKGHCVSTGESDSDAVSAGAPIRDPSGEIIAVFIIAAPRARISSEGLQQLSELAIEGALKCEGALRQSLAFPE